MKNTVRRRLKDMRNNWWMWVTEFNPLKRILNYNASTSEQQNRTDRHQNQSRINWPCVAVLRNGSRISLFIDLEIVSVLSSSVPSSDFFVPRDPPWVIAFYSPVMMVTAPDLFVPSNFVFLIVKNIFKLSFNNPNARVFFSYLISNESLVD